MCKHYTKSLMAAIPKVQPFCEAGILDQAFPMGSWGKDWLGLYLWLHWSFEIWHSVIAVHIGDMWKYVMVKISSWS